MLSTLPKLLQNILQGINEVKENRTDSPIENAKVYQPETSQVIETCGPAFLNLSEQFIISKQEFAGFDAHVIMDYYMLVHPFYTRINQQEILKSLLSKLYVAI